MRYELSVCSIYELGQRNNQEDNIFPAHEKATANDRAFILCDGMGGHSAGEVASRLVCENMGRVVQDLFPDCENAFTDADFKTALSAAYDALDCNDNGESKKMGTTMTFLKFHKDGATIAHIGDSRVYHIRSGADKEGTEILFQTCDHSLVNDLVKIGEMTPEEAKVSKKKNVITRAMQPLMERRPSADIHHITDIRPGDYFFMCSDGILENMDDEDICYIFSDAAGDIRKKADLIVEATAGNKDNHTAFLIYVEASVEVASAKQPATRKPAMWRWLLIALAVIVSAALICFLTFGKKDSPQTRKSEDLPKEQVDSLSKGLSDEPSADLRDSSHDDTEEGSANEGENTGGDDFDRSCPDAKDAGISDKESLSHPVGDVD